MQVNPIVVEITRGDLVESVHRGAFAIFDNTQGLIAREGDIDRPIYPRSAVKPIQALPLVETHAADYWNLTQAELALACASHSGQPAHVVAVRGWLKKIGLSDRDIACGAHHPIDQDACVALFRDGEQPGRIHNNCSGKHAGFLTTARHLGESIEGYLDVDHPIQQRIKKILSEMTDTCLDASNPAIDGCGAPVFGLPLRGLAFGMARFAAGENCPGPRGAASQKLYEAMSANPWMLAGSGRWSTSAMQLAPGQFVVKGGAEGVYCGIVPSRELGFALKIDDGANRAAESLMGQLLVNYGHLANELSSLLQRLSSPSVINAAGLVVGDTRAI
ncbi:MAG: asparaginase [Acidiferrobacteraceae bacterium]|nr:asparaginase [Acidiferrobacteraceae bacterium]